MDYSRMNKVQLIEEIKTLQEKVVELELAETERKRAEGVSRESEERLRGLFETMAEGVVVIAPDGQIVQANPAAERILGLRRSEIEGRDYIGPKWKILRPDGTPMPPEEMAGPRAMREKRPVKGVVMGVKRPDDFISWINVSAAPLMNESGEFKGVVGTFVDITEHKRAEEALRESEERFRQLAENIQDAFWVGGRGIGDQRQVLYVSPVFERIFGIKPEEVYKSDRAWLDIVHEEDRDRVLSSLEGWLQDQGDYDVEYRIVRPDGSIRWIKARGFAIRDEEGGIYRAVGVAQDITERKRAEETLRESEATARALLNVPTDFVFLIDARGIILALNETAFQRFGRSSDELLGLCAYDLFLPDVAERRKAQADKVFRSGKPNRFEDERAGTWFDNVVYPIFDARGEVTKVAVVARDITERKQAEEALRESEGKMRSLLETSPDFITMVDRDGTIQYANRTFPDLTVEEVIGSTIYDFMEPEYHDEYKKGISQVFQNRQANNVVTHRIGLGGSIGWYEARIASIKKNGQVIAAMLITTDITERKRAEEALRESGERYQAIFEQAPDSIVLVDAETGALVEFNDRTHQNLGYTREEFEKLTIADFEVIESAEEVAKHMERIVKEGADTFETKQRTKDGEIRDILVSSRALSIGGRDFLQSIWRDITERKRAEEALRESEEKHRLLLATMPDIVLTTNQEGVIQYSSQTRYIELEDVIGRHTTDFLKPEFHSEHTERLQRVFETGDVVRGEVATVFGRDVVETIVPLKRHGEVNGVMIVVHDITERKRAEEEIRQRNRELAALLKVSQRLAGQLDVDEILDAIARSSVDTLPAAEASSLWLYDEQPNQLAARAWAGHDDEAMSGLAVSPDTSLVGLVWQTRQPQIVNDVSKEPAFERLGRPAVDAIRSVIGVPLIVEDKLLGALFADNFSRVQAFNENDLRLLQSLANQAAIALENARLFEQVQAAREQLRDLAGYLQAAREEERTQIAREIHDEFGQVLTALKMDLAWLAKRLPTDEPSLVEKASTMSGLVDDAIQTVRHVATELRPGLLDDLGLAAAIEWQAQEFAERTRIDCELYVSDEEISLDRDLATAVFRIFQETLTNVARHAEATKVHVELEDSPDALVLVVRDNGQGITESQASAPGSLGLMGMRERVRAWDGDVTFAGVPGQGTTVTVHIPRLSQEEGWE